MVDISILLISLCVCAVIVMIGLTVGVCLILVTGQDNLKCL